jgi:hypothetical protein
MADAPGSSRTGRAARRLLGLIPLIERVCVDPMRGLVIPIANNHEDTLASEAPPQTDETSCDRKT